MIELKIVSGPEAGRTITVQSLPCRLGRSRQVDVVLSGPGVWDHHLDLIATAGGRVGVRLVGEASMLVDGQTLKETVLQGGALLDLGGVRVRFGLVPREQATLAWREKTFWIGMIVLLGIQVALLVWTGLRR